MELWPLRYRFSAVRGDPYDDNWLVIGGSVMTPEGVSSGLVLAFNRVDRSEDGAAIRMHLSMEAAPPWQLGENGADIYQSFVEAQVGIAALLRAADR